MSEGAVSFLAPENSWNQQHGANSEKNPRETLLEPCPRVNHGGSGWRAGTGGNDAEEEEQVARCHIKDGARRSRAQLAGQSCAVLKRDTPHEKSSLATLTLLKPVVYWHFLLDWVVSCFSGGSSSLTHTHTYTKTCFSFRETLPYPMFIWALLYH